MDELPSGTQLLHGQYTISDYLNSGGFGITYRAQDSLGRPVVIKECFPGMMCRRQGNAVVPRATFGEELAKMIQQFVQEAHSLAALSHKNIVHVHQVFEENGTAYMAIDFIDGLDLLEIIETYPERLTPPEIVRLTKRSLHAIRFIHEQGLLHRDISPDNILIDQRGEPILIDFGAARRTTKTSKRAFSQMKFVKDGYSPQEFYIEGGQQGPWSDLYSFAASMYHAISGEAPVDGQRRLSALAQKQPDPYTKLAGRFQGYPTGFLEAIDAALIVVAHKRLQSTDEWLARLKSQPVRPNSVTPERQGRASKPRPLAAPVARQAIPTPPTQDAAPKPAQRTEAPAPGVSAPAAAAPKAAQAPAAERSGGKAGLLIGAAVLALAAGGAFFGYQSLQTPADTAPVVTAETSTPAQAPEPAVTPTPEAIAEDSTLDAPAPAVPVENAAVADSAAPASSDAPLAEASPSAPSELALNASPRPVARPIVEAPAAPVEIRTLDDITGALSATRPAPPVDPADLLPNVSPVIILPAAASPDFTFIVNVNADAVPALTEATLVTRPGPISVVTAPNADQPAVVDVTAPAPLPVPISTADLEVAAEGTALFLNGTEATTEVEATVPAKAEAAPLLPLERVASHWDVVMPFASTLTQLRNADTIVIDAVEATADLSKSGEWIAPGVTIYSFNGARLTADTPLSVHFLEQLSIDPDGYTRATVRYRGAGGAIERGLLAVPVVRQITLSDGTTLSARVTDGAWIVTVLDTPANALRAGDVLLREVTTGTEIDGHVALAAALNDLAASGAAFATFDIRRGSDTLEVQIAVPAVRGE